MLLPAFPLALHDRRTPHRARLRSRPNAPRNTARHTFSAMSTLAHCCVAQVRSVSLRYPSPDLKSNIHAILQLSPALFAIRSPRFRSFSVNAYSPGPEIWKNTRHLSPTPEQKGFITILLQRRSGLLWSIRKRLEPDHGRVVYQIFFSCFF